MYHGHPATVVDERGAHRLGIENIRSVVGRGILLDVAPAKGVDRLDAAYAIK